MQLSCASVLPYLFARSWVDQERVLSGDAVVIERKLRHTSFTVEHRDGSGVFLKQLHNPVPDAAASLRREAKFVQAVSKARVPELVDLVPAFVGYDEHDCVLAFSRLDGVSLLERTIAGEPPDEHDAEAIGEALGSIHDLSTTLVRDSLRGALDDAPPWAFRLPSHLAGDGRSAPGAGAEILPLIQAYGGFAEMLENIGSWWRCKTLIHADLKWENVIVTSESPGVGFVDWELAGIGDPAWDAGTFLQAGLVRQCLTRGQPAALNRAESGPLPAIGEAFWSAWAGSRRLDAEESAEERTRVAAYAAARLVYSAYEQACAIPSIVPAVHAMLATAWEMMCEARHALSLLGLSR